MLFSCRGRLKCLSCDPMKLFAISQSRKKLRLLWLCAKLCQVLSDLSMINTLLFSLLWSKMLFRAIVYLGRSVFWMFMNILGLWVLKACCLAHPFSLTDVRMSEGASRFVQPGTMDVSKSSGWTWPCLVSLVATFQSRQPGREKTCSLKVLQKHHVQPNGWNMVGFRESATIPRASRACKNVIPQEKHDVCGRNTSFIIIIIIYFFFFSRLKSWCFRHYGFTGYDGFLQVFYAFSTGS